MDRWKRLWRDTNNCTRSTGRKLPCGIRKNSDEKFFYEKQSIQITLTRNTSARIDLEIGPQNILHGVIIYYTPIKTSSDNGMLTVISNVDGAKVFLDKEFLKASPVSNLSLRENQYQVKVTAEGHEEIDVPIVISKNYSLNLKTYHFPIPTTFDTLEEANE